MSSRAWMLGGIIALVVVCATILGALGVVPGERVLELLGVVVAAFFGSAGANLLRPSPRVETVAAQVEQVDLSAVPPPPDWPSGKKWPPDIQPPPEPDGP